MNEQEREQERDRTELEAIRSRWARIKGALIRKRVEQLQANVLEATMLKARLEGGEDRGHAQRRD